MPYLLAYSRSTSGVSCSASTVNETVRMRAGSESLGRSSCIRAVSTGQASWQRVKMKSAIQGEPARSARATFDPSRSVSSKCGRVAITVSGGRERSRT